MRARCVQKFPLGQIGVARVTVGDERCAPPQRYQPNPMSAIASILPLKIVPAFVSTVAIALRISAAFLPVIAPVHIAVPGIAAALPPKFPAAYGAPVIVFALLQGMVPETAHLSHQAQALHKPRLASPPN